MTSWSDPNPSDATAAKLQSQFHLQAPNIGGIVAAMLQQREQEARLRQEQMNSLIKGIGSVAGGAIQGQQQGSYNDAANRAVYMAQNPGSQSELGRLGADQFDQTYVPDYGGTTGFNAWQAADKYQGDQQKEELAKRENEARTNLQNAQAYHMWLDPSGYGDGNDSIEATRQNMINQRAVTAAKQNLMSQIGGTYQDFPANQAALNSYQGGAPGAQGTFPALGPFAGGANATGRTTSAFGPDKDRMIAANRMYQEALARMNQGVAPSEPAPAQQPQQQSQQMPQTRFDSENDARAAGHKSGDQVMIFDPASKRYRPAVLN
jgi:hypothetical protein